ncbi:tetratricopeptide repeat protein [Pleionea sediminis]|uniref:tetratricopeptide repeat protein n=1 Tax=Pleionea sediminis TaxID=2569479 RepID=UPI001186FEFC|nr:tetratricopeptide repeat protein [Pleionea sediminis]
MSSVEQVNRLEKFAQSDPDNISLANDLLNACIAAGELDKGIELASNMPTSVRQDPKVAFAVGMLSMAKGNYEQAVSSFQITYNSHPENVAVSYNYAYALFASHEFEKASKTLLLVENQWRVLPTLKLLLARCLHYLGELKTAIQHIEALVQVEPTNWEAKGLLSLLLLDDGQYEAADQVANEVLGNDDKQLDASIARSSALISMKDIASANDAVTKALEAHPTVGRLWSSKGQLDMLSLDFQKAISSLHQATKHMPDHIGTWHLLGWTQMMTDDLKSARGSFDKALQLNRNFGDTHGGLAVLSVFEGNLDSAKESMRRALGLDSESMAGLYAKALILEKEGNVEESKVIMEKIMQSDTSKGAMAYLPMMKQMREMG